MMNQVTPVASTAKTAPDGDQATCFAGIRRGRCVRLGRVRRKAAIGRRWLWPWQAPARAVVRANVHDQVFEIQVVRDREPFGFGRAGDDRRVALGLHRCWPLERVPR